MTFHRNIRSYQLYNRVLPMLIANMSFLICRQSEFIYITALLALFILLLFQSYSTFFICVGIQY